MLLDTWYDFATWGQICFSGPCEDNTVIIFEAKFQELYLDNVQSMERVIAGKDLTATEEQKQWDSKHRRLV